MSDNPTRSYWKDLGLVIVGGVLAIVPVLVSTNIQEKSHARELMLDRKLAAVRDYSRAISKMETEIEKACDRCGIQIDLMESKYANGHISRLEIERRLTPCVYEIRQIITQTQTEANTCRVMVNFLFGLSPQVIEVKSHKIEGYIDPIQDGKWTKSYEEYLDVLRKDVSETKKDYFSIANTEHQILTSLVNKMLKEGK